MVLWIKRYVLREMLLDKATYVSNYDKMSWFKLQVHDSLSQSQLLHIIRIHLNFTEQGN